MAFPGLIANEDAISITRDLIAGDDRVYGSDQMNGASAIAGFVSLKSLLAGAADGFAREI